MKRPQLIPPFKTFKEEAEYWDTHSVVGDWEEKRMVKLVYKLEPKKAVIHVKVGEWLKNRMDS